MNKKHTIKRAVSMALAMVMALGVTPLLPAPKAEAADFSLGSGFTDPTITVATMYYWKEGLPPYVGLNGGKTEGSTIGAEYPVHITWGGGDSAQYFFNPSTVEIKDTKNGRVHRAYNNPNKVDKSVGSATVNVNKDTDARPHGLPPGFYVQWRDYTSSVSLFNTLDIAKSLTLNGVAASMDVNTNLYMVPTEDSSHYAFEIGRGSNKWIVGELHWDQRNRDSVGYENSGDWYLDTFDYDKNTWVSATQNVPVREADVTNMEGYDGYEQFDLRHRTWTFSENSGKYSIGTDGTASWYVQDWKSSSQTDWRNRTKDWVNSKIWDWTELWLSHEYHFGNPSCLETWGGYNGDWSHSQANSDGRYLFRVFYGEPNLVSFIQTDTRVQDGQVVNLDGPIVIGQNATVTVEDGGVLVVSGWVMNGGYIMVKPGGMLIVQDQERLDGTHQYGVINCYEETPNKKYGRISCDGIMIVNRDCKVFGAGAYGLQFGEGAQCINYGQLVSENFEVYTDHTIENRGDVSAVFAGWGLTGGGFAMANKKIAVTTTFNGQGTIEKASAVKLAKDAVYGDGANRVYINTASKVSKQTGMANRKGYVTDIEPFSATYTPKLDRASGVYYVTDAEGYRYDWYDSLQNFARFEYKNGEFKRYDFGGRYIFPANAEKAVRAAGVADYAPATNNFYVRDGSYTYWYNGLTQGFLAEAALTDVYYPGTAILPAGVKGATVERQGTASGGESGVPSSNTQTPAQTGPTPIEAGKEYYIQPALNEDLVLGTDMNMALLISLGDGIRLHDKGSGASGNKWTFEEEKLDGFTYYRIQNRNGEYMDAPGSVASNGLRLDTTTMQSSLRGWRWVMIPDGDGYVIASALDQKFVLDVPSFNAVANAEIKLYEKNGGDNQRWKLVPVN